VRRGPAARVAVALGRATRGGRSVFFFRLFLLCIREWVATLLLS
jgi:hypothetical protein